MADTEPRELQVELVLITRSAVRIMCEEALERAGISAPENETGGILVGRRLNDTTLLVLAATDPGGKATREQTVFEPDLVYTNQVLAELREIYQQADYMGTWHKHPPLYPTFSYGDVQTAHSIFADPDYGHLEETLNPIVWVKGNDPLVRYYYMSRAMAERREVFAELDQRAIREIDDDHPVVRAERDDPEGAFRLRLNEERRLLVRDGYTVSIRQQEQQFFFVVRDAQRLPDTTLYLSLPADFTAPSLYPKVPPVLAAHQGERDVTPLTADDLRRIWTRDEREPFLIDVVRVAANRLRGRADDEHTKPMVVYHAPPPAPAPPRSWLGAGLLIGIAATFALLVLVAQRDRLPVTTATMMPASMMIASGGTPFDGALPAAPLDSSVTSIPPVATPVSVTAAALVSLEERLARVATATAAALVSFEERLARAAAEREAGNFALAREILRPVLTSGSERDQMRATEALADVLLAEGASIVRTGRNLVAANHVYQQLFELNLAPDDQRVMQTRTGIEHLERRQGEEAEIARLLQLYDAALAARPPDGDRARQALRDIEAIRMSALPGWEFPAPPYDERIGLLADLHAEAYIAQGAYAQQRGRLVEALSYYDSAALLDDISAEARASINFGRQAVQAAQQATEVAQTAIAQTAMVQTAIAATQTALAVQTAAATTPFPANPVPAMPTPLAAEVPTAALPGGSYRIDIREASADELRAFLNLAPNQPIPPGTNAFVTFRDGLSLSSLQLRILYSERAVPIAFPAFGIQEGILARIVVIGNDAAPVRSIGVNAITPEVGKFYVVDVSQANEP
jgi:tetratricopeptide (TPR) repeat protein